MRDRNSWTLARVTRGKSSSPTRAHSPCDCVGDSGELWREFHCDDNIALGGIGEVDMQISRRYSLVLCNFTFTNLLMFRYGLWKFLAYNSFFHKITLATRTIRMNKTTRDN